MSRPEGPGYGDLGEPLEPADAGIPVTPKEPATSDIHTVISGVDPKTVDEVIIKLRPPVHPVYGHELRDREPVVKEQTKTMLDPDPVAVELAKRGLALGAGTAFFVFVAPNLLNDAAALAAEGFILYEIGKGTANTVNYVRRMPEAWRNVRRKRRSRAGVSEISTPPSEEPMPEAEYRMPGPDRTATPMFPVLSPEEYIASEPERIAPPSIPALPAEQPNDHKVAKGVGIGAAVVGGLVASRTVPHAADVVGTLGAYTVGARIAGSYVYEYGIEKPLKFMGDLHRDIRPKKPKKTNPGAKK